MRLYLSSFRLGSQPGELLRLLDGRQRRTAVICNAVDGEGTHERTRGVARELSDLVGLGLDAREVDLREHDADPTGVRERLSSFDLVWTRGGNAFVLRRALRRSGADRAIRDLVLRNELAYAGYSAGALVVGQSLHGIELVDDPSLTPIGYLPGVVWEGLGLLRYCVLPHFRSDHPESAVLSHEVLEHYIANHVPFIALRDGEAIVRDDKGDRVVSLEGAVRPLSPRGAPG